MPPEYLLNALVRSTHIVDGSNSTAGRTCTCRAGAVYADDTTGCVGKRHHTPQIQGGKRPSTSELRLYHTCADATALTTIPAKCHNAMAAIDPLMALQKQ